MKEIEYNDLHEPKGTEADRLEADNNKWDRLTEIADQSGGIFPKVVMIIREYPKTTGIDLTSLLNIDRNIALDLRRRAVMKIARERRNNKERESIPALLQQTTPEQTV